MNLGPYSSLEASSLVSFKTNTYYAAIVLFFENQGNKYLAFINNTRIN